MNSLMERRHDIYIHICVYIYKFKYTCVYIYKGKVLFGTILHDLAMIIL